MHKSQLLLLAPWILAACQAKVPEQAAIGKPNPAAEYCVAQGGQYDLETGKCARADGEVVDAWEYFRASQ
ncbi:putative hemolysin [Parahaliea aestuarii]|uniref:DUF333 domain-containing protein n=1 Tax=Parahaliea aestuarii TaxID=1852021 RepID=A0A5C8ZPA0_9GAMM|nr:DUF333 domain-containing protein [Parahaliea aestuarii]TXS90346.1 DUF333 domain-containing protein [Parahaliea aestuarii]